MSLFSKTAVGLATVFCLAAAPASSHAQYAPNPLKDLEAVANYKMEKAINIASKASLWLLGGLAVGGLAYTANNAFNKRKKPAPNPPAPKAPKPKMPQP